ncbi:MAG: EAL and HDOD domain-containing protein [Pseudomonadota bacterium]
MTGNIFLTRQPVLNRNKAITATRLLLHMPAGTSMVHAAAELQALAEHWPGERTVFVGFVGATPSADLLAWQVPQNAMIEIPAAGLAQPATQEVMHKLAQAGVSLCLTGYGAATRVPAGFEFRFVLGDASAVRGNAPGLLIAQGVGDNAQFDACVKAGFGGAAGWFFLRGATPAKKLNPGHAQIVRVLNLVRHNAEIRDIEAALKQDVALSFKLLRYINSAAFGLPVEIQSFRHAVTILGYDKLNRWLSLLLVTASKDPAAPALMQTAIARARFMELIGQGYIDRSETDNLFITGAFSLLDTLLGVPMETALEEMRLPEAINDALIGHQGAYAPFLDLALACERADAAELAARAEALQITAEVVNRAHLKALAFADSLQLS